VASQSHAPRNQRVFRANPASYVPDLPQHHRRERQHLPCPSQKFPQQLFILPPLINLDLFTYESVLDNEHVHTAIVHLHVLRSAHVRKLLSSVRDCQEHILLQLCLINQIARRWCQSSIKISNKPTFTYQMSNLFPRTLNSVFNSILPHPIRYIPSQTNYYTSACLQNLSLPPDQFTGS
jgi:hypothetical protein